MESVIIEENKLFNCNLSSTLLLLNSVFNKFYIFFKTLCLIFISNEIKTALYHQAVFWIVTCYSLWTVRL